MDSRLTQLEETASHQARVIEELSDIVRTQADKIDRLERRVTLLMTRAADWEAESMGSAALADQKPPHW